MSRGNMLFFGMTAEKPWRLEDEAEKHVDYYLTDRLLEEQSVITLINEFPNAFPEEEKLDAAHVMNGYLDMALGEDAEYRFKLVNGKLLPKKVD